MHIKCVLSVLAVLLPLSLQAQAGQVVGTNGVSTLGNSTNWNPDIQAGAFAQVTTNRPRSGFGGYGSGSLELSGTGVAAPNGQYPDWGFYYRYANTPGGFGSLSSLSELSFDWYRESVTGWNASTPSIDWAYKTPVMRLVIQDKNDQISELIWEGYYNRGSGEALNGAVTPVDRWVSTNNMQNGNFWFNRPPPNTNTENRFVDASCTDQPFTFWQGGIPGTALQQLLGQGGCLENADAKIIGIAVGVGSQWPLPYHGFVDNVRMGFGPNQTLALDANFDFVDTVPEPSTYALMGAGLLAIGIAARRRRQANG